MNFKIGHILRRPPPPSPEAPATTRAGTLELPWNKTNKYIRNSLQGGFIMGFWHNRCYNPRRNLSLVYPKSIKQKKINLGKVFEKVLSPKSRQNNFPKSWKSQDVRILSIGQCFYPLPHAHSMQQTLQIPWEIEKWDLDEAETGLKTDSKNDSFCETVVFYKFFAHLAGQGRRGQQGKGVWGIG